MNKDKKQLFLDQKPANQQEWYTQQLLIHSSKTSMQQALRVVQQIDKTLYTSDAKKLTIVEIKNAIIQALTIEKDGEQDRVEAQK